MADQKSSVVIGDRLSSRHRGRAQIRRPDRTDAILSATYALLVEVGYDKLTIDAIAASARASKATIYLRWPGKRDLVIDAFRHAGRALEQLPAPRADLRADLTAFLEATREVSGSDDSRAFLSLLAASQQDPAIGAALRGSLIEPRRACRQIVERAIDRGELEPVDADASAERIVNLVVGQTLARQLVLGEPFDDRFVKDLVENLLLPTLRRS